MRLLQYCNVICHSWVTGGHKVARDAKGMGRGGGVYICFRVSAHICPTLQACKSIGQTLIMNDYSTCNNCMIKMPSSEVNVYWRKQNCYCATKYQWNNAYQQFIPICATKHRNDKITSWYDLLIYNFPFNCAWYITSALSTLCSFVSKGAKTKAQISRVFLARERVPSSCTSLARIRDNLRELGMKSQILFCLRGLSWRYRVGGSLWLYLKIEWNKDGIRTKFDVFIPNSRKLSLILAELVHELGTRTHWGTLHQISP